MKENNSVRKVLLVLDDCDNVIQKTNIVESFKEFLRSLLELNPGLKVYICTYNVLLLLECIINSSI